MDLPLSSLDWVVLGAITVLSLGVALYLFFKTESEAKNFNPLNVDFSPVHNSQRKVGVTMPIFKRRGRGGFTPRLARNLRTQFENCEPKSPEGRLSFSPSAPFFSPFSTEAPNFPKDPVVHRVFVDEALPKDVLKLVKCFKGGADDDATEWILALEDTGRAHGWRIPTHRRAAISKLEGGAHDWHVVEGSLLPEWPDWRAAFLRMFVRELTVEQWTHLVEGRVRQPTESGLEYSLAKRRICAKCPVPLNPTQVIQRMVLGLNSPAYKAAIISNFPTTIEAYFDLIRRLDQAQLAELPVSVGIGETTATTDGVSAGNFNSLVDRVLREVVQKIPPSDNRACLKCGMKGHVAWQCPSMRDFAAIPKSPEAQGN